jgi:hypothetical protein
VEIRRDEGISSFDGYVLTDEDGNPAEFETPEAETGPTQYGDFFNTLEEVLNNV